MKNLLSAIAILFLSGWLPLWNSAPKDTLQLALQGNIINGSPLTPAAIDNIIVNNSVENDKVAELVMGNYFISAGGFGVLVNDHYYGGEITNRFFNSLVLSWIAFFVALSLCGIRGFLIF